MHIHKLFVCHSSVQNWVNFKWRRGRTHTFKREYGFNANALFCTSNTLEMFPANIYFNWCNSFAWYLWRRPDVDVWAQFLIFTAEQSPKRVFVRSNVQFYAMSGRVWNVTAAKNRNEYGLVTSKMATFFYSTLPLLALKRVTRRIQPNKKELWILNWRWTRPFALTFSNAIIKRNFMYFGCRLGVTIAHHLTLSHSLSLLQYVGRARNIWPMKVNHFLSELWIIDHISEMSFKWMGIHRNSHTIRTILNPYRSTPISTMFIDRIQYSAVQLKLSCKNYICWTCTVTTRCK